MPKLSANDYRLRVDSSSPGTFAEVAGQISVTIDRGEVNFSNIDKASTVETTLRAMRNFAVSLEYRPDLPDANGHGRLEAIYASGASTVIQVVKVGTPTVVFSCPMRVSAFNFGSPLNDVNTINVTLTPTAAPTVDALS
jgi:predicted secreted protein